MDAGDDLVAGVIAVQVEVLAFELVQPGTVDEDRHAQVGRLRRWWRTVSTTRLTSWPIQSGPAPSGSIGSSAVAESVSR